MTDLLTLRNKIKEEGTAAISRKVLLFGPPKSGKTLLASTIAKVDSIKKIYWFDLEGGIETVLNAQTDSELERFHLTDEQLSKIQLIDVRDTHEYPIAAETILKSFTAKADSPVDLCTVHGKVKCPCIDPDSKIKFSLRALGPSDAVVIDTKSQLADSIISLELHTETYKDLRKYYGAFTIEMNAIESAIQAAGCTIIAITHQTDIMSRPDDPKVTPKLLETVPLVGSQNYSRNKVGKYYGWVINTEERAGKYLVGSSPYFKSKTNSGNRANLRIEDIPEFDFRMLFDLELARKAIADAPKKPGVNLKIGK